MARTWLINSRGIAKKVKNATRLSNYQTDLETDAKRECPNCKYLIDNSDVSLEWPGLPAGVKFDPSDLELIEHLAGKAGLGNSKSHMFIDEFIPTLDVDQGICYAHPENLPGVKRDGSSVHFFHRTSNAYATGRRKRRKIQSECTSMSVERVRWHKTGKTKPVLENGIQKGWKKIMVLYKSSKRGCKPDKANWVMHQYHLGAKEEEDNGELVVSKVFYQLQLKQADKTETYADDKVADLWAVRAGPRTPKTNTPQPPRQKRNPLCEVHKDNLQVEPVQPKQYPVDELPLSPSPIIGLKDEGDNPPWWAGESHTIETDPNGVDEPLRCHEVLDSFRPIEESSYRLNNNNARSEGNVDTLSGFSDLDNIVLDTPPDLQLADLQFGSQESITGWFDRLRND